jgi:hypothetical protein
MTAVALCSSIPGVGHHGPACLEIESGAGSPISARAARLRVVGTGPEMLRRPCSPTLYPGLRTNCRPTAARPGLTCSPKR